MTQEPVELIRLNHVQVRILPDDSPSDPRENDNLGTIVCWHRRYKFGYEHRFSDSNAFFADLIGTEAYARLDRWFEREYRKITGRYDSPENKAARAALHEKYSAKRQALVAKAAIILPVFMYDHSVQRLSTESFIGRAQHADWDSGQLGFIYVTKTDARKEYGRLTKKNVERALKLLRGEIEEYDLFISGQCYGFVVETLPTEEEIEEDENAEGDELDSCWGFLGLEYCREEALSEARAQDERIAKAALDGVSGQDRDDYSDDQDRDNYTPS